MPSPLGTDLTMWEHVSPRFWSTGENRERRKTQYFPQPQNQATACKSEDIMIFPENKNVLPMHSG